MKLRAWLVGALVGSLCLVGAPDAFAHHHKKKHHHHHKAPSGPTGSSGSTSPTGLTNGAPCTYADYSADTPVYQHGHEFICMLKKSPGCSPVTEAESPGPCSYFWEETNPGGDEGAWLRLPIG